MITILKFLSGSLKGCLAAAALWAAACASAAAPRVATSDWATAETLAAMGVPPIALGDKRAYQTWVNYPPMGTATADSGLRFQPNLEQLYRLQPDMFIQSDWFAHLKPQFEQIAPVHEVAFATPQGIRYADTVAATRRVGRLLKAEAAAEKLIADTEKELAQLRRQLEAWQTRPLAVIQLVDARHARIYGKTSLYQQVLDKLGLRNAWTGASNQWGFAQITLTDLARLPENTLLLIVRPYPPQTPRDLVGSALWRRLPFACADRRRILAPSWSYGALPAMRQFARQLAAALPDERAAAW